MVGGAREREREREGEFYSLLFAFLFTINSFNPEQFHLYVLHLQR